jgi:oligopeptide/dipeptide ABC transporter ATP-binding protein
MRDLASENVSGARTLLAVRDLHVAFSVRGSTLHAVNGVSFDLAPGETLAVVGESGCGKSVTAAAIMGLLPRRRARISGELLFNGIDLLSLGERRLEDIRGREIAQIFQEPMTALNPLMTIGRQVSEPLVRHKGISRAAARARAAELLRVVHIPDAEELLDRYPHELSGGMRQRVMIASALACEPKILIADEPTTAIDVTIQSQILRLLEEIKAEFGTAIILVTHDLGVVAEVADRAVVLYAGTVAEEARVDELFSRPRHPYTRGLMAALPSIDAAGRDVELAEIPGTVPALHRPPRDCPYASRCPRVQERCRRERPEPDPCASGHRVACWFPHDD